MVVGRKPGDVCYLLVFLFCILFLIKGKRLLTNSWDPKGGVGGRNLVGRGPKEVRREYKSERNFLPAFC